MLLRCINFIIPCELFMDLLMCSVFCDFDLAFDLCNDNRREGEEDKGAHLGGAEEV